MNLIFGVFFGVALLYVFVVLSIKVRTEPGPEA